MIINGTKIIERCDTINCLMSKKIANGSFKKVESNHHEHGIADLDGQTSVLYLSSDKIVKHNIVRRDGRIKNKMSFREDCYNKYCEGGQALISVYPADYFMALIGKRADPYKNYVVYKPIYNYPNNCNRTTKYYVMKGTYRLAKEPEILSSGQCKLTYIRISKNAEEI